MNYQSTRGKAPMASAAQAIKKGLADDGGLYMPNEFPKIDEAFVKSLATLDYAERAAKVLALYLDDYDYDTLLENTKKAYGSQWTGGVAPIAKLSDNIHVLELWHGPTCAFKDMALQIMPRLLCSALKITDEKRKALILVATSGDTGKAALEGYKDVDQTAIHVFYPENGVSRAQKRQMQTQEGSNVCVSAIVGNFDDAQSGVKRIFASKEFAAELDEKGVFLSSANSINWGRLAPQIVYYISAYCDMCSSGELAYGDLLDVCVPTGNFGNILAAYIAKVMGLPLGKLICASNDNNVLTDFFTSGTYNKNRPFHATISPSMDILISSNLERLLYISTDADTCAGYMSDLMQNGQYTVDPATMDKIRENFAGYWCSEEECKKVISDTFERYGYLCDTHTAVALHAANAYAQENSANKILVASTASPYKFAASVCDALGIDSNGDDKEVFERLSDYTKTDIPKPLYDTLTKEIRFNTTIEAESMKNAVREFTDSLV